MAAFNICISFIRKQGKKYFYIIQFNRSLRFTGESRHASGKFNYQLKHQLSATTFITVCYEYRKRAVAWS